MLPALASFGLCESVQLRTPLHTVAGYTELLARTTLDDEQDLYLQNIQRACHSLSLITRSVLDFSKLDRGGEDAVRYALVNIRGMLEGLGQLCEERNVHEGPTGEVLLIIAIDRDVPASLWIDETYLLRVLMNVCPPLSATD